jgi:4-diphosphocytidyl-2-C-methyl-D-erythritol kinase
MDAERFAPAKLNLFLHVGPLGIDGYHPICSLVTFADVGDTVAIRDTAEMGFEVGGPFAAGLEADAGNLVVRARDAFVRVFSPAWSPFRLTLKKELPIASGLGGGSADAAAALALMAGRCGISLGDERLGEIAQALGADVPMCLEGEPRLARGRGDVLSPPPAFPETFAVLVNPLAPSATGRVYAAFDAMAAAPCDDEPDWPAVLRTPLQLARFLARCRNDLEAPAISLQPAIAQVLEALRARPETLFARMSGSGATCFALCAGEAESRALASAVSAAHPDWWVRPCRLAGAA